MFVLKCRFPFNDINATICRYSSSCPHQVRDVDTVMCKQLYYPKKCTKFSPLLFSFSMDLFRYLLLCLRFPINNNILCRHGSMRQANVHLCFIFRTKYLEPVVPSMCWYRLHLMLCVCMNDVLYVAQKYSH